MESTAQEKSHFELGGSKVRASGSSMVSECASIMDVKKGALLRGGREKLQVEGPSVQPEREQETQTCSIPLPELILGLAEAAPYLPFPLWALPKGHVGVQTSPSSFQTAWPYDMETMQAKAL